MSTPETSHSSSSATPSASARRRQNRRKNKQLAAADAAATTNGELVQSQTKSGNATPSNQHKTPQKSNRNNNDTNSTTTTTPRPPNNLPLSPSTTPSSSSARVLAKFDDLFSACQSGDADAVLKVCRDSGFNVLVSARHSDNFSPLQQACHFKQLAVVKAILNEVVRQQSTSAENNKNNNDDSNNNNHNNKKDTVVHDLLSHTTKSGKQTPLLIAAAVGALDIFKFLVEFVEQHEIDIVQNNNILNQMDAHKNTSLLIAAREGHEDLVEYILSKIVRTDDKNNNNNNNNPSTMINAQNADRATAFSVAASSGSVECARLLLQAGADPSLGPVHPLLLSCQNGRTELTKLIARELITSTRNNFKIDDIKQRTGATCLMLAAQHGRTEVVDFLIDEAGADIFAQTNDGMNALAFAVWTNKHDSVKKILEKCPKDRRDELLSTKITMQSTTTTLKELAQKRNSVEALQILEKQQQVQEQEEGEKEEQQTGNHQIIDERIETLQAERDALLQECTELKNRLHEEQQQHRQKSDDHGQKQQKHIQDLQDENNRLQLRVSELENEIQELKSIVLAASPSCSPVRNGDNNSNKEEIIRVISELTGQLKRERETQTKLQSEVLHLKKKVENESNRPNTSSTNIATTPVHQRQHQRRGSALVSSDVIGEEKQTQQRNQTTPANNIKQDSSSSITSKANPNDEINNNRNDHNHIERRELEETIFRLRKQAKENDEKLEKEKNLRKREEMDNQSRVERIKKEVEESFSIEVEKLKRQLEDQNKHANNTNTNVPLYAVSLVAALGIGFGLAKVLGKK